MANERVGWTLETLLWCVAYSALTIHAALSPVSPAGLVGLLLAGLLVWTIAYVCDARRSLRRPADAPLVMGAFAIFAVLELALALSPWTGAARFRGAWFGMASLFAIMGLAIARVRTPGEFLFAVELGFHASMLLPGLVAPLGLATQHAFGHRAGAAAPHGDATTPVVMFAVSVILLPVNLLFMSGILLAELRRPDRERSLAWESVLALQIAYIIMAVRGAFRTI